MIDPCNVRSPTYGDFTGPSDYHTALNKIMDAEEAFSDLDSRLRDRFQNDPAQLLEFISNSENYEEALNLGLLSEEKTKEMKSQQALKAKKQTTQTKQEAKNDDSTTNSAP